jgi:hypothetical protein
MTETRYQRLYERKRAQGLCVRCPNTARPGRSLCTPCARARAAYLRDRYAEMRQALLDQQARTT